jgi:CopA family copper-resistance protein
VDELRLAVAETYDVIVTVPDTKQAYTLFAETMDRSGYARATLTAGAQTEAEVPARRRRPLLTMADMGMMQHGGHGGHGDGGEDPARDQDAAAAAHHGTGNATAMRGETGTLAVVGLPDRVAHGPEGHGPSSIAMGDTAYRRLDDPGIGLGDDGRRVLTYGMLAALRPPPGRRAPTREINLHLTGNMHRYVWGFDGKKWSESDMLLFQYGERLRINFINDTMMNHPLHLHGMWMDLYAGHAYHDNPRKHTINIQPAELLTVDITADAPGQWAFHCHFLYHMETGMFRTVAVVRSLEEGPVDVR